VRPIQRNGIAPRDATRGGVNRAALPRERGRESPLQINQIEAAAHALGAALREVKL
jgi:hypothetical protein